MTVWEKKIFVIDSRIGICEIVKNKCGYDDEVVCRMSGFRWSPACSSKLTFFYLNPVGGRTQQNFHHFRWHEGIFVTECHVFASQSWQELIEQGELYVSICSVDTYFFKSHPENIYTHE